MSQKGFSNVLLIILIIAVIAIGGYFILSKRPLQLGSTTSPVTIPAQEISELIDKWTVVSVEENDVQIVSVGSNATIEFFDNGTYKALDGCNEMSIHSYTISDSKISFEVGGSKRKCTKNIVEFWDLAKVYSYEFNDGVLLLRYKTDGGLQGVFRLQKS